MMTPEELERGLVDGTTDKTELDKLLMNNVHENENIDTLVHFFLQYIPGNRTFENFIDKMRKYNNATICGLVWNANVIAYRCKTCSISPCMSICAQCFQNGNHEGHNYNMFKSQAGGACDCGDPTVMHDFGFCCFHGENRPKAETVPHELICCAKLLIPHLLKAFIRALRMSAVSGDIITEQKLLEILNALSNGGSAVQKFIIDALIDKQLYEEFITKQSMIRLYHHEYLNGEHSTLPVTFFVESLIADDASNRSIKFDTTLYTMLDEIMMWCVTTNLPEELVRFLLSLLPDLNFKLLFTETFLRFYGVICQSLVDESLLDASETPSRLVHISVQLLSSNVIAEYAMEKCHLIDVILSCIWHMFASPMEQDKNDEDYYETILKMHPLSVTHDESNTSVVVDVEHRIIVKNVYWPLLSDFVNILAQEKIALTVIQNKKYFNLWLRFLTLFQGMNVTERLLSQHIEYETQAYMYAFTIELEISAAAMWCFVNHLKSNYPNEYMISSIKQIIDTINDWMQSLNFQMDHMDPWKLTFHLPLHRYLSIFAFNAINKYSIDPSLFLPIDNHDNLLSLIYYPLRTICGYYEILSNIWLRNGQTVLIQAKTYAKTAFSSSMHDADLFLLQLIACYIEPNIFIEHLLTRFHVYSWLFHSKNPSNLEPSQQASMLESALIVLCAIVGFQPNIGIRQSKRIRSEIITALAVSDRAYSEVEENVPDPSPLSVNRQDIDDTLQQVSDFQTPSVEFLGQLQQGKYVMKGKLFETEYDPIHAILRCSKRAYFQNSFERFTNHVKHEGLFKSDHPIWPPFRLPTYDHTEMSKVQHILQSNVLHHFLYLCLNTYLTDRSVTENILYFTIYLLELSIRRENDSILHQNLRTVDEKDSILINICKPYHTPNRSPNDESEMDTIITLLFKILQKQRPNDFYDIISTMCVQADENESKYSTRIGDCFYFISNIFYLSSKNSDQCRLVIEREIEKYKTQHQHRRPAATKTSDLTIEQKRQRAKLRQQKLLAEITQSQKQYISQQNQDEQMLLGTPPSLSNERFLTEQTLPTETASTCSNQTENIVEYECCVCRLTKSSTQSPIGLIGTSCLSFLPSLQSAQLNDYEQKLYSLNSNKMTLQTYSQITKESLTNISRHPYISNYCQNDDYLRSLIINSCGHSIHLDCLSSYLRALNRVPVPNEGISNTIPSDIEFHCPLCRQIANTLIPLFDHTDYINEQVIDRNLEPIEKLHRSMQNPSRPTLKRTSDKECLLSFVQVLGAKCTLNEELSPDIPTQLPNHQSTKQRAVEVDCAILRSQIAHQEMFYDSGIRHDQNHIRKSFFKILHELYHLAYPFCHQQLWEELTGRTCPTTIHDIFDRAQNLPPILLRDPITMFIQLLMSLPINITIDEFDVIVQIVYNIEFYRNLIGLVMQQSINSKDIINLNEDANFIMDYLEEFILDKSMQKERKYDQSMENYLMDNNLKFFKIISLMKYRLFSKEIPWRTDEKPSASALANYLNLKLNLNGLAMPQWYCDNHKLLLEKWFNDLRHASQHHRTAVNILCIRRPNFNPPMLIDLPLKYDELFHMYNEYPCEFCSRTSSQILLCLICGEIHMKQRHLSCCDRQETRYDEHLAKCGYPSAVMLDIETTLIIVSLKKQYGYWHSIYLDQHGEEDPKLKRGKTLFLNSKRYSVLRTLWLTVSLDSQIRNWIPYNPLMIDHFDVIL